MSQPQSPNPSPSEPPAESASAQPDPLLDKDSFIAPERNESGAEPQQNAEFEPGVVIAAEPISMLRPGGDTVETPPRSAVRRRNADEMSKKPSWLPEDWKIDLRVRSSGATAGLIDRYYIEPSGQRRFRSKNEVLHFLETGNKQPKRKADAEPSENSASKKQNTTPKQKKSSTKGKKSEALNSNSKKGKKSEALKSDSTEGKKSENLNSDSTNPANGQNGVQTDTPQET